MLSFAKWDHVGIRVSDRARAVAFYEKLGFAEVAHHPGPQVTLLRTPAGLEINLISNSTRAPLALDHNVLMDQPELLPGITHVALRVESISDTMAALSDAGIPLSGGPEQLGDGISIFVRDPDRNVVEMREALAQ